jgi:DNA-binding transcriptional LysR family regulator
VHRADDAGLHLALAEAGLGVGLLPALACTAGRDVRFARIAPPAPRRHVFALVRRGASSRPAAAAVLDALARRRTAAAGAAARGEGRSGVRVDG